MFSFPCMAAFVSAFDEAPKTPTRSYTTTKHKVVVASPENTPPSSPSSKSTRRSHGARMPFVELNASQITERSVAESVVHQEMRSSGHVKAIGAVGASSSAPALTDTFSNAGEASELGMCGARRSQWMHRFSFYLFISQMSTQICRLTLSSRNSIGRLLSKSFRAN